MLNERQLHPQMTQMPQMFEEIASLTILHLRQSAQSADKLGCHISPIGTSISELNSQVGTPLMPERTLLPRRGSYGIDAPYAPAFMGAFVVLELALAIFTR